MREPEDIAGSVRRSMAGGRAVAEVVERLVKTTAEVGGDISAAAREAAEGSLLGAQQLRVNALDAVAAAAGAAVKAAAEVGGDIAAAAKGAVQGAIAGAKELGVDAFEPGAAAASGALGAAGEIGGGAVQEVERAVSGTIDGVKVKAAPLPPIEARAGSSRAPSLRETE